MTMGKSGAMFWGSRKSVKDDVLQSNGIGVPRNDFEEDIEDESKNSIRLVKIVVACDLPLCGRRNCFPSINLTS